MNESLHVRKWVTYSEEVEREMGHADGRPLKKVAVCAVIANPYAGRYVDDLKLLVEAGEFLGEEIASRAAAALGEPIESYGKGGIVGLAGDQEHINALLTTVFGDKLRAHAGGGTAWISSMTKRAPAGTSIDIPLAYKDALYVRSHYDGISVAIGDAPGPDEIVVIGVYANRGRLNARIGGVLKKDAIGDGVR